MNPIFNMMGNNDNLINSINNMRKMMNGNDPNAVMQMMAQRNPQFAQFLQQNRGKTPEQVAKEYGIDWGMVKNLMK